MRVGFCTQWALVLAIEIEFDMYKIVGQIIGIIICNMPMRTLAWVSFSGTDIFGVLNFRSCRRVFIL